MKDKIIDNLFDSFKSVMPIAIIIVIISYLANIDNTIIFTFAISCKSLAESPADLFLVLAYLQVVHHFLLWKLVKVLVIS